MVVYEELTFKLFGVEVDLSADLGPAKLMTFQSDKNHFDFKRLI